jgi:hypothetical protein
MVGERGGKMLKQEIPIAAPQEKTWSSRSWVLSLTSFLFILLQSACTAFMAISGLRLLIGIGSLAAASSGLKFLDAIHGDAIRIPMMILAVGGSVVNLYAIWRVRSLRMRSSSQWRVAPATPEKKRAELIQIALAILTLLLVAAEWMAHIHLFKRP